jgi:predicted O-methyltransferase YrrM
VYRYEPGGEETFAPHIDAGFPPSGLAADGTLRWDASSSDDGEVVSRLTVLMYLNDDFVGGETKFYQPLVQHQEDDVRQVIASVRPQQGSILVFPQAVGEDAVEHARQHWPLHEGSPVVRGNRPKYVIRSDVLFATRPDELIADEEKHLFRYDGAVRDAFLPQSPVFHRNFLHHVSSLYNPHMGVENLGPLLYSFVRFTKVRRIVEIGAGYTSLWILQALRDNDDELERIRDLQRKGQSRLLDIQWLIEEVVEHHDDSPSSLLCIDNCEHEKETATGAASVARTLGLDDYMEFRLGDAFDLTLEEESVDLLWCDFGVGARMREFISMAWSSIRPGGFLLCHSTLTNRRTREWLERIRCRKGQEETGIPPDEYVELTLLEHHKRFQNSVSVLQKRKGSDGRFEEPIYSEYA